MDFSETDEQRMLREAVDGIAVEVRPQPTSPSGPAAGGRTDELWNELGAAGFLGVNVPAEYGGGGMGITELAIVLEELAANGCPLLLLVVSPAICATIIARFGSDDAEAAVAARASARASSRWRSPSPSPTPGPTATRSPPRPPATATSTGCRGRSTTSPAPTSPKPSWW